MDKYILHLNVKDMDAVTEALKSENINFHRHVTMAFDSATPLEWLELAVSGATSKEGLSAISGAIGYFLARNAGKKVVIHTVDGKKIEINGYSNKQSEKILEKVKKIYFE